MIRTLVRQLPERVGGVASVYGFVDTLRLQSRIQFVVIRDHTGKVQVTHKRTAEPDTIEKAFERLTPESAVKVTGQVVANPVVKAGGLELVPEQVEVVSLAEAGLPIDERTAIEHRLDWRFLDLRRPEQRIVVDAQTTVERTMRRVAAAEGFTELHTPS